MTGAILRYARQVAGNAGALWINGVAVDETTEVSHESFFDQRSDCGFEFASPVFLALSLEERS